MEKILKYFKMQQAKSVNILIVKSYFLVYINKKYQANNSIII